MKNLLVCLTILICVSGPAMALDLPASVSDYYHNGIERPGPDLGMALIRNGNAANNRLGGSRLADSFDGAQGNDILVGYGGHDVYTFEPGDGLDLILDHSPEGNTVRFLGRTGRVSVTFAEVSGFDGETDRLIKYGENDAVRIVGWSSLSDETKALWKISHFTPTIAPRDTYAHPSDETYLSLLTYGLIITCVLIYMVLGALYLRRRNRSQ